MAAEITRRTRDSLTITKVGPAGPANTLTIGTVQTAPTAAVSLTGQSPNQVVNITLPVLPVTQSFSVPGTVDVGVGRARFYAALPMTISAVRASVAIPPTGQSILIDVLKNGLTIFDNAERPLIPVGANTDLSGTPRADRKNMVAGDYLTVSILQVGSQNPGADLNIQVEFVPVQLP
jgi:hypothetical protein